jgi:hypothetical protein
MAEDARKGKGVSKEAQEIFDRLSRTLPTRWEGKDIVANDSVVIEVPYRPEDCKLLDGAPKESLGRVRKVVSTHDSKGWMFVTREMLMMELAYGGEEEDG